MALPFNPQVPAGANPQYWYWAKSATQPMTVRNTSTETALDTIGDALREGADLEDSNIKQGITKDIQNRVDKQQSAFTSALETVSGHSDPMNSMDLMPDSNKPNTPTAVDSQLSSIKKLQASLQGNKISETYYYQNLNKILKDVRAQYPGYRDYVDNQVHQITGVNPANAYMASMVHDINAQRTKQAAEQQYYTRELINSGFAGSDKLLAEYQSGKVGLPFVQKFLSQGKMRLEGLKEKIANFELTSKEEEAAVSSAKITANSLAEHAANDFFSSVHLLRNDPNSPTASGISDTINDMIAHPEKIDPEKARIMTMQFQQLRDKSASELTAMLENTKNKDGISLSTILGPDGVRNVVQNTIGNLYDIKLKALSNQDYGLLHATNNALSDRITNVTTQAFNDPSFGGTLQVLDMLGKVSPQLSAPFVGALYGAYKGTPGSSGDIGVDLHNFGQRVMQQGIAQAPSSTPDGKAYTFNQALDETQKAIALTHASPQAHAQVINNVLGLTKALEEKDPRVVHNAISFFYDPKNYGALNKFMEDYHDPNKGIVIKGRTAAFNQLTSDKVTKSIARFKQINPADWEVYQNFAIHEAAVGLQGIAATWSKNLDLIKTEKPEEQPQQTGIFPHKPTLRDILGFEYNIKPNHQFYWDSDKHQLGLMDTKGRVVPTSVWNLNQALFQFRNANEYFKGLTRIAEANGEDPNQLIFQTLKQAWPLNPESQKIFQAIVSSMGKKNDQPQP